MALDYQLLGRNIQRIRNDRGISQMQFAELIGTSPTFVSRMERGLKGPSLETLLLISDALRVPLDNLFSDQHEATPDGGDLSIVMADCTAYERRVLLHSVQEIKYAMRENRNLLEKDSHSLF